MTTPAEARIDEAAMYFWVAEDQRAKLVGDGGGVEVITIPERRVASLGARGSHSPQNFVRTRDALLAWLRLRADAERAGPPYAVYWNGPFVPGFLKRHEVHVPVRPAARWGGRPAGKAYSEFNVTTPGPRPAVRSIAARRRKSGLSCPGKGLAGC